MAHDEAVEPLVAEGEDGVLEGLPLLMLLPPEAKFTLLRPR